MNHCILCEKPTQNTGLCNECVDPILISTTIQEDDEMKSCAYEGCFEEFEPTNNRQKFCPAHSQSPGVRNDDDESVVPNIPIVPDIPEEKPDAPSEMINIIQNVIDNNRENIKGIRINLVSGLTIDLSQE